MIWERRRACDSMLLAENIRRSFGLRAGSGMGNISIGIEEGRRTTVVQGERVLKIKKQEVARPGWKKIGAAGLRICSQAFQEAGT